MKTKILKMLRQSDDFVSGQSICSTLNVSRTAVWKVVNQLKEEGYEFDAVSNKGYRIVKYPDIVTAEEIMSQLEDDDLIKKVIYFDETDSTNNQAKIYGENGCEDGTLFITECQTGGRGRRGRDWSSPPGSGIWMSLLIRPDIAPQSASMLTLVTALAASQALGDIGCRIKWPNDLVLNSKKICGILTEMSANPDCVNYVVIGIGINVNTKEFPEQISDTATSVFAETGENIKRSRIITAFSREFKKYYDIFLKTEDLSGLVDMYNDILVNAGRQVRIEEREDSWTGEAVGIDETGALLVKRDKKITKIVSGEVSVRGLYGYV